jgi:hypothetical protein
MVCSKLVSTLIVLVVRSNLKFYWLYVCKNVSFRNLRSEIGMRCLVTFCCNVCKKSIRDPIEEYQQHIDLALEEPHPEEIDVEQVLNSMISSDSDVNYTGDINSFDSEKCNCNRQRTITQTTSYSGIQNYLFLRLKASISDPVESAISNNFAICMTSHSIVFLIESTLGESANVVKTSRESFPGTRRSRPSVSAYCGYMSCIYF